MPEPQASDVGEEGEAGGAARAGGGGTEAGGAAKRARNTVIFSIATGLSRIAGLAREVVASAYFGTSGAFSAFTLAFTVPNVVRAFFADAALSAAFVPVFTELLEEKRRAEAFRLATTLLLLVATALGALTVLFVVAAAAVMPLVTGDELAPLQGLVNGLSQVLFPIVLVLGLNGLTVGILQTYDHFTVPALSPLVWNAVIIAFLVGGHQVLDGDDELYAYAVGIVVATVVQFAMSLPVLRRVGFRFAWPPDVGMPQVRQVFVLMLPVTIGIGLINVNALVNGVLGSFVSEQAPRAIDAAFRIYMLPQGMFSVAIATVLFPALSRLAARRELGELGAMVGSGMRQVLLLLTPAAAATLVLAEPLTRLVYERGAFGPGDTELVATALLWFSFSLPTSGLNLLLTRTFFSLQRPWATTALAGVNIAVNVAVSVALYRPFGIAGIVAGTAASSVVMALAQAAVLRRAIGGIDGARTLRATAAIVAGSAVLGGVALGVWTALDDALGRALPGQLLSVGAALALGGLAYVAVLRLLGVEELRTVERMVRRRVRRVP